MKNKAIIFTAVLILALCISPYALAISLSTYAEGQDGGSQFVSETATFYHPSYSAFHSIESNVELDFLYIGYPAGSAYASADTSGDLKTSVRYYGGWDYTASFYASSNWSETFNNDYSIRQNYFLYLEIPEVTYYYSGDHWHNIYYNISISSSIYGNIFFSEADGFVVTYPDFVEYPNLTGTDIGGWTHGNMSFGTFEDIFYLGSLDPLEDLTVSCDIAAMVDGFEYPEIVDVNLALNVYSEPAPEPATMLLFGAGLVGLIGVGRKKFFKKL